MKERNKVPMRAKSLGKQTEKERKSRDAGKMSGEKSVSLRQKNNRFAKSGRAVHHGTAQPQKARHFRKPVNLGERPETERRERLMDPVKSTGNKPAEKFPEPQKNERGEVICPVHFLTNLGLCARAGRLIFGADLICEELRAGKKKPVLVLVAGDCAANNRKRLLDRCAYYETDCLILEVGGADLAHAVGKRAKLAAVGVTDVQMLRLLKL